MTGDESNDLGGFVEMEAVSDLGGILEVRLSRSLEDSDGWENDDPEVFIVVKRGFDNTENLTHLRASDLEPLIRGLQQVYALAHRFRILPPELPLQERLNRAAAELKSTPEPEPAPDPKETGGDDEFDAGDSWKRGTKYDHTLKADEAP